MARAASVFPTVHSEGGLLPPDLLQRIVEGDSELGGFAPGDYGLAEREPVREAIARGWQRVRAYWAAFKAATEELPAGSTGVTETREQWVLPLLRTMGYGDIEFHAAAEEISGRRYAISHRAGGIVPVHIVSLREELDRSARSGDGSARLSPHALVQEFLNRSEGHLYGLVSNGCTLRLLRDNFSLTRLAYVDFDLKAMLEGGVYADFVLLWLALHRTRLPHQGVEPGECWLERWRERANTQGVRAMGELRGGVERALVALGTGLLAHPANELLRERLRTGQVTTLDFYAQLLRLVYRVLFLFVAEERDLVFAPGAAEGDRRRYVTYYSLTRLRDLARRYSDDVRHDDLWRGVQLVFEVLAGRRQGLGLPVLGGGLFSPEVCPDVDGFETSPRALLSNAALSQALLNLSVVRVNKRWRRVNYRDLDTEELGGVYEALLEQQPRVIVDAANPHFELVGSGERKQTGSYYTPSSLVDELIKSALDPVIADRLSGARTAEERQRALLGLSVCDSATGSGHFLLAAARRIADELARARAGDREPSPADLRQTLRDVIRHCIYGVDVNPLAVDLCRLSLWLESHEPGKPLTFLDHRVKLGNSLIGSTPDLAAAGVPDAAFDAIAGDDKSLAITWKKQNRKEREAQAKEGERQASFVGGSGGMRAEWARVVGGLSEGARAIAELPENDPEQLAAQRTRYETYRRDQVAPARELLDAWTGAFFWPLRGDAPAPITTADLHVSPGQRPSLSAEQWACLRALGSQHRFFHWPLEFPEVFDRGGFDCVLGNPPWEKIKLQELEFFAERDPDIAQSPNKAARQKLVDALPKRNPTLARAFAEAKRAAESQSKFVRTSGRFRLSAVGDVNLYALFAEHKRIIVKDRGRAGVIVPTGIATDDSMKDFFGDLVATRALVSYFGFKNEQFLFPKPVEHTVTFGLLTMLGSGLKANQMEFTWFAYNTQHMNDPARRVVLTPQDLELMNPNTRTCPIFRTRADADLTRAIYRRVPVLIDEHDGLNPWGVDFLAMFHMSNDSGLFRTEPGAGLLPLYEAKLFHQFNHRWATYDRAEARDATLMELSDPSWHIRSRYWVERSEVEQRLRARWERGWLLAFRDIARATDERTAIFGVLPRTAAGNKAPILLPSGNSQLVAALTGNLTTITFDFVVRQKVAGATMNFFLVKQFPVLPPSAYRSADLEFIVPRILELTYTAWDLQPFAKDLGNDGPPFKWDEDRRALLRAELDAYYAALYGLTRDELRYVLDPQDVYGSDFPGETFRVLKEREIRQLREYRTRRLVLEAWDGLGLEPRNRDGRYEIERVAHAARESLTPAAPTAGDERAVTGRTAEGGTGRFPPGPGERDPGISVSSAGAADELLSRQVVQERTRTPARVIPLPDRQRAQSHPLRGFHSVASGDGPAPAVAQPPSPPVQANLPGFTREIADLRARVLRRALEALRGAGSLTGREIAQRLEGIDSRIDRHLVNSVLSREGADSVRHDPTTGKYRVKSR